MSITEGTQPTKESSTASAVNRPRANVTITVTPRLDAPGDTAKARFWRAVRNASDALRNSELNDDELERRLERRLAQELRNHLISLVVPKERYYVSSLPESTLRLLVPIMFRVRSIEYHSAMIDLDVAGISQLAQLFDDNFEAFASFLMIYFPSAFEDAIEAPDLPASALDFSYVIPPTLFTAAPVKQPATPITTNDTTWWRSLRSDRSKWFWIAANGTLLVPAILSLVIGWALIEDARAQRDAAARHFERILQHEQVLLSRFAERDAQLKALNEALVKAVVERLGTAESRPGAALGAASSAPISER